jgi:hypothetical protein
MLYPNPVEKLDFADAEHDRFGFEKTGPLFDIGVVFSGSKMACSAKGKTILQLGLGIYTHYSCLIIGGICLAYFLI